MAFWQKAEKREELTKQRLKRKASRGNMRAQQKLMMLREPKKRRELEKQLKRLKGPSEAEQQKAALAGTEEAGAVIQSALSAGGPEAASDPEKLRAAMEAGGEIQARARGQEMGLLQQKHEADRRELISRIEASKARAAGAGASQVAQAGQTASIIFSGISTGSKVMEGVAEAVKSGAGGA